MTKRAPVIFILAFAGAVALAGPREDLRAKLASNDVGVRNAATAALLDRWEEMTPAEVSDLEALSEDTEAEVAAAARETMEGVRARRRYGPWLWERASGLATRIGEDKDAVEGELVWAAGEWRNGHASDRELGEFLSEAWRANDGPPPYSRELAEESKGARSFARLFDAWIQTGALKEDTMGVAMEALASAGDPAYAGTLVPDLESQDTGLRHAALKGLADLKAEGEWKKAIPLLHDPIELLRRRALQTLVALNAKESAPEVRKSLEDPSEEVIKVALRALAEWKDSESLPAFEKFIADVRFQEIAAEGLVALGKRLPDACRLEVYRKFGNNQPEYLAAVFGDHLGAGDRDALIAMTASEKDGLKATIALQRLLDPEEALALMIDGPAVVRRAVLPALSRLPREKALAVFRHLLKEDDDAWVRGTAAGGLADLGDRASAADLVPLLHSRHDIAFVGGYLALAGLGAIEQAPDIARGLHGNNDRQRLATRALDWLDAREFAPAIREESESGEAWNRKGATELLIRWSDDADWLASQLESANDQVHVEACDRLIRLGHLDRVWDWFLGHHDFDGLYPDSTLVALLDSGQARASELVMTMPARQKAGHMTAYFRIPWTWAVSHAAPVAFSAMPKRLRADTVRRLRNLSGLPFIDVEMPAKIALARLGELSDDELRALFESAAVQERIDFDHPGRSTYLQEVLAALSAAKEPASWDLLHRPLTPAKQIVTEADLTAAAAAAGLRVDTGDTFIRLRTAPGATTTLRTILERQAPLHHVWVLEGRTIRFIPRDGAIDYWRRRLAGK
ncbi:MAG: HEAT repeat domain-containing protein [Planctomycetes bacterium]|nr:HEAT repeat domain-containing protein [Planctomycetota bacterium]